VKALVFDRFGGPEVLDWRQVPDPRPAAGEALVRLKAVGLNFADVYRRRGDYHLAGTPPFIAGYEGAGVIEAPGAEGEAQGFRAGDRVGFADSPFANAELAAVAVDKLIPLPGAISFETAAAVLLQGLTAQYLCRDSYRVRPGDEMVVHSAGGGVGLMLCAIGRLLGARVFALASSVEKLDAATEAGADAGGGYDGWVETVRTVTGGGAHVVYDAVGTTLLESLEATRTGGTVVFYGFAGGQPPAVDPRVLMDRSLTLTGGDLWNVLTSAQARRSRAAELFSWIAEGEITPRIAARYPLSEGGDAHRLLESRGAVGKILLIP
jgi:NADPH2:quinone reductase